jgi:opacity protein-like surface antigen
MKGKQGIATIFFLATTFSGLSQIELGGEEKPAPVKAEKVKEIKEKREKDGSTEIYFVTNWSSTFRKLETNEGPFGDPLGERESEKSLSKWSFGVGFRNELNDFVSVQAGISYMRNGESYLFEETDTLFKYSTTYSYIAMPVKVLFTYGNEIKFLAGGGITPQLFLKYVQEQEWQDSVNAKGDLKVEEKNGYSSFALSAAFNIGIQFQFSDNMTLLFMPEYRIQFTDSYQVTDSYNHFGRALGFDLGLTYKL